MLKEPLQFGNPEGGRLSGNSGLSGRYILKLMEYAPIGMALTDPAGHVLEFNDSFPRITGYAADELLGLDYRTHCTGLEEELCRAAMQAKGYYGPYLRQFTRKDGQVVSLLLHSVQATENDQTFGIWLVVEDITERMQAAIKDEQ